MKRVEASEFEQYRERLGEIAPQTVDMIYRVVVDGESAADVARALSVSRALVARAVSRFWRAHDDVPAGWKKVVCYLPAELIPAVRQIEASARSMVTQEQS